MGRDLMEKDKRDETEWKQKKNRIRLNRNMINWMKLKGNRINMPRLEGNRINGTRPN